jgi:hypothetical protein
MKINWTRLIVGSLIAALICFLSDGFFHEQILGRDWDAVYSNLGITEPPHQTSSLLYFAIFELGRGFVSMLFYATMRTHFGAGPKTAMLAGIASWVAFSLTGPAQFIPLGFFSNPLWLKVAALQLVTSIVATIAGAALYKDAATPVASRAT